MKMASSNSELQERNRLYKFTKVLTLKVAQIVVQSRQGKKITQEPKIPENNTDVTPPLQWFNLSIPDEPAVNEETKHVLNGEVADALAKVVCIEISLHTTEGDDMVLEVWTVKLVPGTENCSPSTIYYRMSVMLKSTLTISRVTPAYKLARAQHKESYKIYHKIYGGEPKYDVLGEKSKAIKVSELHTPIGTLLIDVVCRTKMTILPEDRQKIETLNPVDNIMVKSDHFNTENPKTKMTILPEDRKLVENLNPVDNIMIKSDHFSNDNQITKMTILPEDRKLVENLNPVENIMFKSDHFSNDNQMKNYDKKEVDLSKPLTAGAFVDTMKIKELHETLNQKLPPEPSMGWLLDEKEKMDQHVTAALERVALEAGESSAATATSDHAVSKPIEVPKEKSDDKSADLMKFPFADGSPISDLATFYKECVRARTMSDTWDQDTISTPMDSDTMSRQLQMFEDAIPEFDDLVASMCSDSEDSSDPSLIFNSQY